MDVIKSPIHFSQCIGYFFFSKYWKLSAVSVKKLSYYTIKLEWLKIIQYFNNNLTTLNKIRTMEPFNIDKHGFKLEQNKLNNMFMLSSLHENIIETYAFKTKKEALQAQKELNSELIKQAKKLNIFNRAKTIK